jgi:glutathione reductase (NADPH)
MRIFCDEIQAEMIRQGIKIMPETFPTSIQEN